MKFIHIFAGLLALASGAVALYAAKGSTLHRRSGMVFVVAMLVLTSTAAVIAAFLSANIVNVIAALLTFYLVSTGLMTVLRPGERTRAVSTGLILVALTGSAMALDVGFDAANSAGGRVDDIPAPPVLMFGIVGLLGALLDARLLWAGGIQGAHRLARHLWRMTFAMWIATSSFFLGQAKFFPEPIRKSGLLAIPVLLALALLIYWLVRVLVMRRRAVNEILGRRAARVPEHRSVSEAAAPSSPSH